MSSWVLLLAALAAFVRCACTEGDPLPPALVELVRSSPISSIQDLQLLLEPDSVDEDPDSQTSTRHHANGTSKRLPRSLVPEQAQQALCKVRTEVQEVTRDMLDRRNANFMLWPPCVEVQRCSGCCNSRTVQCVPIVTRTRNLQVMKIQYINKQPSYDKAVISVQDHVECRCQSSAPPPAPRATPKKPQHALQPQRPAPKTPPLKTPSKEELHRQDELKQNQNRNLRPDDRDSQRPLWPAKRVTAPPPTAQTSRSSATAATEGRTQAERARSEPRPSAAEEKEPTQETLGARRDPGEGKPPHRSGDGGTVRPHVEQRPHPHPHGQSPNATAHHTGPQRPTEGEREDRAHAHHTQAGSPPQLGSESHNHGHSHSHDHNHKDDHKHIHNHSHSHDHNHKDDHNHDQKHNHDHSHSHDHNHKDDHKHIHNHSHSHDYNHKDDHNHDQNGNHDHSHSHDHNHKDNHNHDQKHNHKHTHNHSHSHDHNHSPNHSDSQHHSHNHNHTRNHSHDHSHNHNHTRNHSHDHSHNHNHTRNHSHDHSHNHNHTRNHSHDHSHNHNHTRNHSHDHSHNHNHTRNHSHDHSHNQTETTEQRQHVVKPHKDRELPEMEEGRLLQPSLQEKQELLLLQRKDQLKEQLKQQEQLQRHHHQQEHHLHHQVQVHTTTKKPVTPAPTPALTTERPPPPPPPTQRPPKRRNPLHKRQRKNRNRISKATMRARLM
ncbi:LIM domain-containing protein A [Anguilla anguilla]|uniref:LIM domain-containing protein A n=1 Tax=Anguilla anguilla TaxID=7936 RepID=UPI0015A7E766|nr:LIM domain-containing protein A [Anguilla anguilla]